MPLTSSVIGCLVGKRLDVEIEQLKSPLTWLSDSKWRSIHSLGQVTMAHESSGDPGGPTTNSRSYGKSIVPRQALERWCLVNTGRGQIARGLA